MSIVDQLCPRSARGILAILLVACSAQIVAPRDAAAQRPLADPRGVSLGLEDLPRGFAIVEDQTALEVLRTSPGQPDSEVVGAIFSIVMERMQTLEHLQSGPIRVAQIVARSDDPTRATFSLDAQREFNVSTHGYEVAECAGDADPILCLVRRDGPFVEYRTVAVKSGDTLVSTSSMGLPSAVNLDSAIALTQVSLARYDTLTGGIVTAERAPSTAPPGLGADLRAVQTPTPAPLPPPPPAAPTNAPPPTATPAPQPAAKAKLPSEIDGRLAQPWSELMASSAKTKSGENLGAFVRRIVEKSDVKVIVGDLRPNVGGELRTVAKVNGSDVDIVESVITMNKDVMNESPRVLAAILAHEIVHANQPVVRSPGKEFDCIDAEVEAYALQANVWSAFWGDAPRPGQTRWERSMNYVEETWRRDGERGLRTMVRDETSGDSHSCLG